MVADMADLVHQCVLDKDLQTWIIPSFSTTTKIDTTVCSAVMMGGMKQYFDYNLRIACGIPSVTLLGDVSDWEALLVWLARLAGLRPAHPQLAEWNALLTLVLQAMVDTFAQVHPLPQIFWSRNAHFQFSAGSGGPTYLSGWITAFCPFSSQGAWQIGHQAAAECPISSASSGGGPSTARGGGAGPITNWTTAAYPWIDSKHIPLAWCEVGAVIQLYLDPGPYSASFPVSQPTGNEFRLPGRMDIRAVLVAGLLG
ncbi:hypothetical protein B0T25DRAFT_499959 [Lasiosphaeria hispida]|uniref:Uncharacterized protein n=1 Tax=Lasiosphaeria hispida TaxID=260671 RepID=A0AAJ0MGU8_9PEZI|nr:hypothetical protein B0T25DRAFT_499959 [Lasiosphaeria hispida]